MSDEPGRARLTYRRVKRAAGVTDLPALEQRVGELEVAVAEEVELQRPLTAMLSGLEAEVAGLLVRRRTDGDDGHGPAK